MPSFLVIGYGNELRGDDGIGPQVATAVEAWNLPNVQVKILHQLTPELAEDLSKVDRAIFVDACLEMFSDRIRVETLDPLESERLSLSLGHASNPRSLLALSLALYDRYPQSWLISVSGVNFELSDRLSPIAAEGVQTALKHVQQLVDNANSTLDPSPKD